MRIGLRGQGRVPGCFSVPAQQLVHPGVRQFGAAGEDIGEPGLRVDVVELGGDDEGVHRRGPFLALYIDGAERMFSKAVPIAAGFTRPVVISSRTAQGECAGTIGAYVVVNRAGWILTAGHLLDIVRAQQDSARRHAGYRGNVVEFHRDVAADKRFRKKGGAYLPAAGPRFGAEPLGVGGWDGVRLVEARVVPAADLALGRLEPFDPASVTHYPVWKDPSRDFAPGRSLCKLGFPLHRIVPAYDEKANTFTLPEGSVPLPLFPMEGMFTRVVNARAPGSIENGPYRTGLQFPLFRFPFHAPLTLRRGPRLT